MDNEGLKTFYVSNVKSVLSYASPVWFHFLTDADKLLLEKLQRYATRIILPNIELYDDRLTILGMPHVDDFLMSLCCDHFLKISNDSTHPLHNRIHLNTHRISSRKAKVDKYRPSICRTVKRQKSFFEFHMRFFN